MRSTPRLAVLALALVAAGCRAGSGDTTTTASTTTTTPTTTTAPAPGLRVALTAAPVTDNWWEGFGGEADATAEVIQHGLTASLFALTGSSLEVTRDLASGGPATPFPHGDHWVVEQRITRERRWSDGVPITAADLVFYFETVRGSDLGGRHLLFLPREVLDVEAVDEMTVRITFSAAPGPGLWPGSVGLAPFVPAHFWGPVVSEDPDGFEAWTGRPPRASEPSVEWVAAEGREAAYRLLMRGEVDLVHDPAGLEGLGAGLVEELSSDSEVNLVTSVREPLRALAFNLRKPPFDDPVFRRAVATVVDQDSAAAALGVAPAHTFVHPYLAQHSTDLTGPGRLDGDVLDRAARVEAAAALLAEAGYRWTAPPIVTRNGASTEVTPGLGLTRPDGAAVPALELMVSTEDRFRRAYAELIARWCADLGVVVEVSEMSGDEVLGKVLPPLTPERARAWDMAILGWRGTGAVDPGGQLVHLFHSSEDSLTGGGTNVTGYASESFDSLAARYTTTANPSRAAQILRMMELTLADDLPQLALYRETVTEAHRAGLPFVPVMGGIGAHPSTWPYQGP